jgi:hypothetical protein
VRPSLPNLLALAAIAGAALFLATISRRGDGVSPRTQREPADAAAGTAAEAPPLAPAAVDRAAPRPRAPASGSLEVRVAGRDGRPLAAAVVRVGRAPSARNAAFEPEWREATDAAGKATFAALPSKTPLCAEVELAGSPSVCAPPREHFGLGAGEVRRVLDFVVSPAGTVRGTVTLADTGEPLAGERVWLSRFFAAEGGGWRLWTHPSREIETWTDALGAFEVEVALGRWRVGLAPSRDAGPRARAAVGREVGLESAGGVATVAIATWRGRFVRGTVTRPDGTPAPGVRVEASGGDLHLELSAPCRDDGSFDFGPVPPGRYVLVAKPPLDVEFGTFADSRPLAVEAGDERHELALRRAPRLRLRVLDELGGFVPTATVRARCRGRDGPDLVRWSDERGVAETHGLPGTWEVVAKSRDRVGWLVLELAPEEQIELDLVLRPAARIAVENRGRTIEAEVAAWLDGAQVSRAAGGCRRVPEAARSPRPHRARRDRFGPAPVVVRRRSRRRDGPDLVRARLTQLAAAAHAR